MTAKIAIGMDRTDAARILRVAGAKAARLDGVSPSNTIDARGTAYETPSGGLLIVDFDRASPAASYRISGLKLCVDPDVPKAKRVWQDLREVAV